jgi:hypothetical protein
MVGFYNHHCDIIVSTYAMKYVRHLAFAALVAASFSAVAATDSIANPTQSVGIFSNTFSGLSTNSIRVFGLKHAAMLEGAGTVGSRGGDLIGVGDNFCVANADLSRVKLVSALDNAFVVAAPQTDVVTCSTPNVYKSIMRENGPDAPDAGTFTVLMTITATLN